MATNTPNYALVKPAYNEWADIKVLNNNLDIIDTQIFAKASKTRQIIAGLGLTGGGDLTTDRTLNIASANDGIIANADNIQLNTIDNLTTASSTKPLSANMGKVLQDTKLNLTGGTLTGALNGTTATFSGNVTAPRLIMTSAQATGAGDAVRYDFANSTYFTNSPKAIPANTNLNTFLTKGHYTSESNANTSTMTNTPFGITSFTLVIDGIGSLYTTQFATRFNDGLVSCRTTGDYGATWTAWTEIINKTTGDATYVKKAGDIMTGGLTTTALAITNGTNETNITARYNNLVTDTMGIYNNATGTGIYNAMPTHGNISIFSRNKSTGVVTYAGGNYGTINGSTATFSGNVTAPSITIGGYVVTIV